MEENNMIKIVFKNGSYQEWASKNFTDYKYDGKCFIIIKGEKWVGIYNIDSIVSIVILDAELTLCEECDIMNNPERAEERKEVCLECANHKEAI